MQDRPRVLIEDWLPLEVISAECARERGASNALPAHYYMHIWWARRPLTICRSSILAGLLPAWSDEWSEELQTKFPSRKEYQSWFIRVCGIHGDTVQGRKLVQWANQRGIKLDSSPYTHKRAFTVNPSKEQLEVIQDLIENTWGTRHPVILDSFAGGGSIPFEALRYGFKVEANELNPVASVILKATLEYPFQFGNDLTSEISKYGAVICEKIKERLEQYFPKQEGESIHAYLWARTVVCPYTGKPIPLSPNWWLRKGNKPVAVRPVFNENLSEARFEILEGKSIENFDPDEGTVSRGNGISPWAHNQPVDGDYIKAEAQAGRMGRQLYVIAVKKTRGLEFRLPKKEDIEATKEAEVELNKRLPEWEASEIVPNDVIPDGNKTSEPRRYGIFRWSDMFSPRQLLSLCTFVEEFQVTKKQLFEELPEDQAKAVATYLEFILGKAVNYNSYLASWNAPRARMRSVFDRHDFSFKWTFGEFDACRNLFSWGLEQVIGAYKGIVNLVSTETTIFEDAVESLPLDVNSGSATDLSNVEDLSINMICIDPPYYDNVMYAECSDFFYVWMKRTIGDVYPDWFRDELTNKDDEAVANVARFGSMGRKKRNLSHQDYERKMTASFNEMHRVLKDDGVLTVMFTHKKVEAWDTLSTSLLEAGFEIRSSWPVHTESEHSLHQAKKNAAKSTILLTCRKREPSKEPVWWDDIKGEVRREARVRAAEFEAQGITGVDLYISTFGPTLSILSRHWPVLTSEVDEKTGNPKPLKPETALDLAREEVITLRKKGLLLGKTLQFDVYSDWYLMAWDAFKAVEFPADEARKLAIAFGIDMDADVISAKRLAKKKSSSVVLLEPWQRRKKGMVDPDEKVFSCIVDAAHTAMMLYKEDGARSCEAFLTQSDLITDSSFKGFLQAMINAIPRTKKNDEFVRPEADILEEMRLSFFEDIEVPIVEEIELPGVQQTFSFTNDDGEGE